VQSWRGLASGLARHSISKVENAIKNAGADTNGWNFVAMFGDRAFYNGDWLKRAAAAKSGVFRNSAEEALQPFVAKEANGGPSDGSVQLALIAAWRAGVYGTNCCVEPSGGGIVGGLTCARTSAKALCCSPIWITNIAPSRNGCRASTRLVEFTLACVNSAWTGRE
jgi:hypothetical protein